MIVPFPKPLLLLRFSFFCLVMAFCGLPAARAQNITFATLQGNPVDTSGWRFVGAARLRDTQGDTGTAADEVMIVPLTNTFSSGAVFYNRSVDLGSCRKFEAEFDFRLFDGQIAPTGADGMAFCFLPQPPTGFVAGGGVGIPPRPLGLLVVLDQ